ncbi:uncharacterized protein LOC141640984 [Silene latifolia]|uniref:uncharacterized protein LOC141640984 n=1 Tax=Silene latifolia TaxID=37657 RepID=UPI003D77BE63
MALIRYRFYQMEFFLVRFKDIKDKEVVLMAGYYMFDNKPLIVKPWTENIDLLKEDVKLVPAWIRFHNLPLKFWGKCIPKIASLVGKFIKADNATEEKTRLGFSRIMVELKVGQTFLNTVNFLDEHGHVLSINVEYEWKPTICSKYKNIGHEGNNCRKVSQKQQHKAPVKKVWKPISKPADPSSSGNNKTYDSEFPVLQNTKPAGAVLQPTDHNETDSNLPPEKDAVSQQSSSPVQEMEIWGEREVVDEEDAEEVPRRANVIALFQIDTKGREHEVLFWLLDNDGRFRETIRGGESRR